MAASRRNLIGGLSLEIGSGFSLLCFLELKIIVFF